MTTIDRTRLDVEIRRWMLASTRAHELGRADLVAELEPNNWFDVFQVQSSAGLLETALRHCGQGCPEVTMSDPQPTPLVVAVRFALNQLRRPIVVGGIAIGLCIAAWLLSGW